MEEWVGQLWHKCITRLAAPGYPDAAVSLKSVNRGLAIFFRALGGDPGLRLAAAGQTSHGARRRWLARVAGSGERLALAEMGALTLRLPPQIDYFPDPALNRQAYTWLAAQAAMFNRLSPDQPASADANLAASAAVLAQWPGLRDLYRRLVEACLAERLPVEQLPVAERAYEQALQQALRDPARPVAWPSRPVSAPPVAPVILWLQSMSPAVSAPAAAAQSTQPAEGGKAQDATEQTQKAERVESSREKNGILLYFRAESLLSVAEFFRINRNTDDEPDPNAAEVAREFDQLSLAAPEDQEHVASRVRFDLDLPSAAEDDLVLAGGCLLPEWDYRTSVLREDHVRVVEMQPRLATPSPLPAQLRRTARRLHQQFAALQPGRRWLKAQPDGRELDLDAVVRAWTDRMSGHHPGEQLHLSLERKERDLACLVLADLSLSTDAWVSNEARVIDVIRDALLLFGEAIGPTGDALAMCGFSSVKREMLRFHRLKDFGEPFDARIRGRILGIRPGYYTRLGAAIRQASQMLQKQPASRRILLILSDGKPNDLDIYDSRYGIEDSRHAVFEARRQGVLPFCLTIDREGGAYLPHLFGPNGYAVLRKPEELPMRLPSFYAQLTR